MFIIVSPVSVLLKAQCRFSLRPTGQKKIADKSENANTESPREIWNDFIQIRETF